MEGVPRPDFPRSRHCPNCQSFRLCRQNVLNKQGLNVMKTTLSNRFPSVKKKKGGWWGVERETEKASIVRSDSS